MATEVKGFFKDQDFEKARREIFTHDVEGWELFVESHGVTIYRQRNEVSGLYTYKTYGEIDVDPEVCANVYIDLEYRKEWDSYAKGMEVKNCEGRNLICWNVPLPFPIWNREYIYGREIRVFEHEGNKLWVVLANVMTTDSVPLKSRTIRVEEFNQIAALTSNGKGGTRAFMKFYDNPGGSFPTWLINWAAKFGVPQFLGTMQKACRGYPEYQQKKEKAGKS